MSNKTAKNAANAAKKDTATAAGTVDTGSTVATVDTGSTTSSEVIGAGDVGQLPEGLASGATTEAQAAAPATKASKLAGLLAQQATAQPAMPAASNAAAGVAAAQAAARARATTSTIKSTPQQYDETGKALQRRNYSITDRQLVMIRSVKGKMIHLTTDINYTNRTPAAAVNKARTELSKQATIKPITVFDDLEVLVMPDKFDMQQVQIEKAKLYDKLASEGWTMLGKRPNVLPKPEAQQPAPAAPAATSAPVEQEATTEAPAEPVNTEAQTEAPAATDSATDASEQVPA